MWAHHGSQAVEAMHDSTEAGMSGTYLKQPGPQPLIWIWRPFCRLSGGRLMWAQLSFLLRAGSFTRDRASV